MDRITILQVELEIPQELQLISRLQKPVILEEIAASGGLHGIKYRHGGDECLNLFCS